MTIYTTYGESPAIDGGVITETVYKGASTLTVPGPSYLTIVRPACSSSSRRFPSQGRELTPFLANPSSVDFVSLVRAEQTFYPTTTTYATSHTTIPTTTKTKTQSPSQAAASSAPTTCAPGDADEKQSTGLKPTHDQSITLCALSSLASPSSLTILTTLPRRVADVIAICGSERLSSS